MRFIGLIIAALVMAANHVGAQDLAGCIGDVVAFRADSVKFAGYANNSRRVSELAMTARVHEACASAAVQRSFSQVLAELQRIVKPRVDTVFLPGRVDTVRVPRDSVPPVVPPPDSTPPVTPPPAGGEPTPGPSSVILWDTRTTLQSATTVQQALALFSSRGGSQSDTGPRYLIDNIDGRGANAIAANFRQSGDARLFRNVTAAGTENGYYVQFRMWIPAGFRWTTGGKVMLMHRGSGNGDRIYLAFTNGGARYAIDGRNWGSNNYSDNPMQYRNTPLTITTYVNPSTGTVRAWLGSKLVLDQSGANIGNTPVQTVEAFCCSYVDTTTAEPWIAMWDWLVWR